MRVLVMALTALLALGQVGHTQVAPAPLLGVPLQGFPTLAPLVKKVAPGVVNIAVRGRIAQQRNPLFNDPFFRRFFNVPDVPAEREFRAAGSGVIVDAREGLVITNRHVVEHADEITVTLTDGRRLRARPVGSDPDTDVAVIKVTADGLIALPLGDSDKLEVGDFVVAVGNPFGLGQTITSGIVSALRRTGLGIEGYEDFIQTDAPINPGNSGGALVDLRGELVGINTAIVGPTGGNVGIGFAIPVNMVRDVMAQLVQFGEVRRGQLGIVPQDLTPDLIQAMGLSDQQTGAVIARVDPGSAAERAGLKGGDVVTELGGRPIRGAADLRNKIGLLHVGDVAELTVLRGGQQLIVHATLTTPVRTLVEGSKLSPLLDGATFGSTRPDTSAGGVEIVAIQPGSTVWVAGLRKGDIITSVNQQEVAGTDEFAAKVKASPRALRLNGIRDGNAFFVVLR
jgi:serine protease Do/serine protease DegQ